MFSFFYFLLFVFLIFPSLMYSRIFTYGHVGCLVLIFPSWMWNCLLSQTKTNIQLCLPILFSVSICFQICCQWCHQQLNILNLSCKRQPRLKKHTSMEGRDSSLESFSKFETQSTSQTEDQLLSFKYNIWSLLPHD